MTQHPHCQGPATLIAENEIGQVSACRCGVLTLTMACVSVRFEAPAFMELAQLVGKAQGRLNLHASGTSDLAEAGSDIGPIH